MSQHAFLPSFKQIGKYKIEGLISRGGMSLLYLATDPETQEARIIKVLLPEYVAEHDVMQRFLDEARIIALANHPNIVRLIDSGPFDGGLYIAMEFVKGSSLRKIFQHQPYALKRAMDVLLQIAYAIGHLHTHGIVHGDLKPENILINDQGKVKVIDFGIAMLLTEEKKDVPLRFLGTPIYMSPELGIDRKNLSFQSDIFALGIIAYELAVGKISHGRVAIQLAPKGLQKLLQKALQPHPQDRYSDMCDFIADLSAYIKSGDIDKDKQGSDQFLELFEKLEARSLALLPQKMPSWGDVKIDFAHVETLGLNGLYVDFFCDTTNKKCVFIAESANKGSDGLVRACMLQALLRANFGSQFQETSHNLSTLVATIQEYLQSKIIEPISYACIIIDAKNREYSFYQNGFGILAHFSDATNSLKISSPLFETHGTVANNDKLLFFGINPKDTERTILEELAKDILSQNKENPPEGLSEAILRKSKMMLDAVNDQSLLSVILLHIRNCMEKNCLL